jgi:hypothetical protein
MKLERIDISEHLKAKKLVDKGATVNYTLGGA